ncbi:hypothetical protein TWF225_010025 [Orbilia oligospora]|nr:hypothetical protein TWF225_010025 [Orbilia oligospora]KAF3241298.1 hypothetical protein TWF217_000584 [Orbilia oligospora]KAF3258831.1 hypothetical protein TWF128_004619 [Orbilia oligospora]
METIYVAVLYGSVVRPLKCVIVGNSKHVLKNHALDDDTRQSADSQAACVYKTNFQEYSNSKVRKTSKQHEFVLRLNFDPNGNLVLCVLYAEWEAGLFVHM